MPRAKPIGAIGERQPLQVRAGHTLSPITVVVAPKGGGTFDHAGGQLVVRLFLKEGDEAPLLADAFDPPEQLADNALGQPRFVVRQSRARLTAALAAAGPDPNPTRRPPARVLWWTCSFETAGGALIPIFYGEYIVYLGAGGV